MDTWETKGGETNAALPCPLTVCCFNWVFPVVEKGAMKHHSLMTLQRTLPTHQATF